VRQTTSSRKKCFCREHLKDVSDVIDKRNQFSFSAHSTREREEWRFLLRETRALGGCNVIQERWNCITTTTNATTAADSTIVTTTTTTATAGFVVFLEEEIIKHRKWNSVLNFFSNVIYVIIQTRN